MNDSALRHNIRLQFYDAIDVILMFHVRQNSFCALSRPFVMIIVVVMIAIGPRMKNAVVCSGIWIQNIMLFSSLDFDSWPKRVSPTYT